MLADLNITRVFKSWQDLPRSFEFDRGRLKGEFLLMLHPVTLLPLSKVNVVESQSYYQLFFFSSTPVD